MEYVGLGKTGVGVSKLGFGTMSFGGDATEETSKALFARCREAGVNFFDCADVYSGGQAERILGRLIQSERNELVITTKAYFPTSEGVNARGTSRYHLVRAVEASLKRLQTDRIDLFFLHRFDDVTAIEETLRAIDDLVRSGKILYPAASNFSAWQAMKALGLARRHGQQPIVAVQPMYNLIKRTAEIEIFPFARSENIAVFPYSPLAGGMLTGKYGVEHRKPKGRIVDTPMYQTRYGQDASFITAEAFSTFAATRGIHPVTLAVAWVAAHPAVTAPLLGARSVEQLEPALEAANLVMDETDWAEIASLSPSPPPATDRSEETTEHNYGSR